MLLGSYKNKSFRRRGYSSFPNVLITDNLENVGQSWEAELTERGFILSVCSLPTIILLQRKRAMFPFPSTLL